MMDLLFTREIADPEVRACAQLLCAVILQAVLDAGEPLTEEEREAQCNLKPHPRAAIEFLFDESSLFAGYARVVGLSAASMRSALLDPNLAPARPLPHASGNGFMDVSILFKPERRANLRERFANSAYCVVTH